MKSFFGRLYIAIVLFGAAGMGFYPGTVSTAPAADDVKSGEAAPAVADAAPSSDVSAPAAAPENEPAANDAVTKDKKWYRGSASAGFDGIWGQGGGQDIDLDQSLQFQIDPPNNERLHLRGSVWMIENVGGRPGYDTGLSDMNDAFDSDVLFRPSYFYMDVDDLWNDSTLRIGRQRIMEGAAYNRIDGLYFKQRLSQWDWYVFGGTRASFYDDLFDNPIFGAGVSFSPLFSTKIALDTYYGSEDREVGRSYTLHGPAAAAIYRLTSTDVGEHVDNGSASLSLWQNFNEYLTLFGRFNWVSDAGSEFLLNATGCFPEPWDVTYELTYRHQFNSVGDRLNDLTGYYRLMGTYESYDNVYLALHRPISEKFVVSLEGEFHDSHNLDWSNRDYQRFAAILAGEKLFGSAALDAQLGLARWDASGGEGTWALTGELGRSWDKIKLTAGVDYQQYEDRVTVYNEPLMYLDMARAWFAPGILQGYNPLMFFYQHYTVQMHQNVYTYYLKADWSITKDQSLDAKVVYEEDDGPKSPYWRLQANYTIRF